LKKGLNAKDDAWNKRSKLNGFGWFLFVDF
jgi:hypothetical protein